MSGYFRLGSKFGGFRIQYCTGVPPAPATVADSGAGICTVFSHESFSCVRLCALPPLAATRKSSAGAVSDAFEKTIDESPALIARHAAAFRDERRRSARQRHAIQIVGAAIGRGEEDVTAVVREDVFGD